MKKFKTLDNQERIANQQESNINKESSTVSLSSKIIIIVAVVAVAIIAVLCVILFGRNKKSNIANPPSVNYSSSNVAPSSSTSSKEDTSIPYSGSNDATVATDMRESDSIKPEVITYDYCIDNGYLFYYVKLYNPSSKNTVQFPTIRITARDADGVLLGNEEQVFHSIYPGQEVNFSTQAFFVDEDPATVTIEALEVKDYNIISASTAEHKEYVPLQVSGVAIRNDNIVGEVINNNDYDISMAWVSLVIRDGSGKMIGSKMTFIDNISAKSSVPFSAYAWNLDSNITVEAYAEDWGY